MRIENIPDLFIEDTSKQPQLWLHDFRMTEDNLKKKINLSMHMFSFLQVGKKEVHFAETSVKVNKTQSLLTRRGNCLWTELLDTESTYYCKLFFFTETILNRFLRDHLEDIQPPSRKKAYFIIENDAYIQSYINSLSQVLEGRLIDNEDLLYNKFEEILLYLVNKYGKDFENYLQSLSLEETSEFKETVEQNAYSNLKLEEIAFLCNMSLSTFKRHFKNEYKVTPGKWLHDKRLEKAKMLLEQHDLKASDVYMESGYASLSNFSNAFKNKFGFSPREV